jgi:CDP-glucose 4,6-dehydratase
LETLVMFDDFYRGKTVLVTGHTGFKGSWLALWLSHLGARVVGYALAPVRAEDNYVAAGVGELVETHEADVRDQASLTRCLREVQPDVVFHLAAQSLVLQSYQEPAATFDVNVQGTVAVLEAARLTPSVRSIVIVTTDKCYDNRHSPWPYRETDALGGHDPYSASRRARSWSRRAIARRSSAAPRSRPHARATSSAPETGRTIASCRTVCGRCGRVRRLRCDIRTRCGHGNMCSSRCAGI